MAEEFAHIMEFAHGVADQNPVGLVNVVRALVRPLEADLLTSAMCNPLHRARGQVKSWQFFIPDVKDPGLIVPETAATRLDAGGFRIKLGRNPVLPWPYRRDRYIDALTGGRHPEGPEPWKQEKLFHNTILWLPWGITFVLYGHDSIALAQLEGDGELVPDDAYDMSHLLDVMRCDGRVYRGPDGQIFGRVTDAKIAAVFEIGRLMAEHDVFPLRATR